MTTPRDEMNLVGRTAADFAFEEIGKSGGFSPFAVAIGRDGGLRFFALGDDQVEDGGEKDLVKVRKIVQAGAKKGEYSVVAVASDVRVRMDESGEVTDAIRVEIEHAQDIPINFILPYRREQESVEQHIDPYMEPGERLVFP